MIICLHLDPSSLRHWHKSLIERLQKEELGNLVVSFAKPSPRHKVLERFMVFERWLYAKAPTNGSKPWEAGQDFLPLLDGQEIDVIVDLSGEGEGSTAPEAKSHLVPLFGGKLGEEAAMAAILQGGLPQIALEDRAQGAIIATASPSSELAAGLAGGLDQTYARLITLLVATLKMPQRTVAPIEMREASLPSGLALAKKALLSTIKYMVMASYRRLFYPSHWRIGWRWVDEEDVWSQKSLEGPTWQVLDDPGHHFYADPFPLYWQGRHYLFFEDLKHADEKGILSVVEFDEQGPKGPAKPCLVEDYHLSYPFFIEEEGELYMIPETSNNGDVALYQAQDFPFGWQRKQVLLEGLDAADVTITKKDDTYWMFCVTRDGAGGYSDCLSLFYADSLFGPWQPHAQNPVLIDKATARPAGAMRWDEGRLYRPVQDCTLSYGAELALCEVTRLDKDGFEQKVVKKLGPSDVWPGRKLHTLNRSGRLEAIDGAVLRPRWQALRPWFDRKFAPKRS
ncbi:MAG: hypothetical protein N4A65_08095 [Cohaesibacter sp.]|jgi:hypothetical protein|nr:hypothetical protein [Cohaesibacter sp.]